jgi:hypothetical protein
VAVLCLAVATASVSLAAPAAATAASTYQQVLRAYEAARSIPPCRFSAAQLQSALSGIDTYGAQYFADFTQAIDTALTARAGGECSGAVAPLRAGRVSDLVARLPSVTAATDASVPAPLIVLAVLAAGLTLAGAFAAGARATRAHRRDTGITEPPP